MVTISPNQDVFIVIISFVVDPSRQSELLKEIVDFLEKLVKKQPGFVSSTLHKSLDGTRVINYAQWRSREDYETFVQHTLTNQAPEIFQTYPFESHSYQIEHQTVQ
jgi:heme-degrading monooxygenase HmoA